LSERLERAKATPGVAFCFLANQLLARETWARERLAVFAGQAFEVRPPLLPPLRLSILGDGSIAEGGSDPQASISAEGISGGALADELRLLARHFGWDVEEELSRVVGDVAARRIGGAARAFLAWQADSMSRLSHALAAYGTDETRLLVRRAELANLGHEIARLEEGILRVEKKVTRLA
jgi:ubiquinone biosynthesis protein UbiJ